MPTTLLINIDVEHLDGAIEFYCRGLGLELRRLLFGGTVAELTGASSPVFLLARAAGTATAPTVRTSRDYRRHWTPVHLDFVVEAIEPSVEKARAAGASVEGDIQTHPWGRLATLSDPFGHGFCLLEFTGTGYDQVAG